MADDKKAEEKKDEKQDEDKKDDEKDKDDKDAKADEDDKEDENDESDDEEAGFTPPSADSILKHIRSVFEEQIRQHSGASGLIALLVGLIMLFDGEDVFKWLVVGAAFVASCVLAVSDLKAEWAAEDHFLLDHLVGILVGVAGAYAAWLGFNGLVVLVGAGVGGVAAFGAQKLLILMHLEVFRTKGVAIVILYSVFVAFGVLLFRTKKHAKGLAIVSALAGGALVAAVVAWGLTHMVRHGHLSFLYSQFEGISPQGGSWLDFFNFIWDDNSDDFGVFAGSKYNLEIRGSTWRTDRIGTVALALAFATVGARLQLQIIKANKEEEAIAMRRRGGASARELVKGALRKALLSEE
mmetsp:Transcript_66720/g.131255  ORF Transcript_66720/g.131255 Transcript_66720/m.131255 type:complete len:352 (-) Transcript_66720:178-1233(-)